MFSRAAELSRSGLSSNCPFVFGCAVVERVVVEWVVAGWGVIVVRTRVRVVGSLAVRSYPPWSVAIRSFVVRSLAVRSYPVLQLAIRLANVMCALVRRPKFGVQSSGGRLLGGSWWRG